MKKFLSILTALAMLLISNQYVFAEEKGHQDSIENIKSIKVEFNEMFDIKAPETIELRSVNNSMLVEFNSQQESLNKVKDRCSNLVENIKEFYGLDDLSDSNWSKYYDGLRSIIDDSRGNLDIMESDYEYRFLRAFFDIYENKYKNDRVKELALGDVSRTVFEDDEEKLAEEIIAENLPYNSIFSKEYFDKLDCEEDFASSLEGKEEKNAQQLRVAINVEPAVKYAEAHATSPNEPSYYYFSHGDCTNFVSQILEYSGVSQEVYDSEHSGWWHKYNPDAWFGKHKHSRSWTMADTFTRYMGVILTRTNHRNFSANVHKGSIIAGDWTNDGDWEHMAFVTAADNYVGSYGYYDYKVAQHTSNYHLWTSNSDNGWENVGKDGGRYGRIRD